MKEVDKHTVLLSQCKVAFCRVREVAVNITFYVIYMIFLFIVTVVKENN